MGDGAVSEARSSSTLLSPRRAHHVLRLVTTAVCAAIYATFAPWPLMLAWFAACAVLQGVEAFVTGRGRAKDPRTGVRPGFLALLVMQQFLLGAAGPITLVYAYPLGLGVGIAILVVCAFVAVMGSRASTKAMAANLAPQALFLVVAVPTILATVHGRPLSEVTLFAGLGAIAVVIAVYFWRHQRDLIVLEAEARRRATSASAAKSTFIATVSHELRTPISAIQAGALALQNGAQDQASRRNADLVFDASRMMRTLLDDLLDMSKVEAGRMSVETVVFDPRSLVVDTLRFWRLEAQRKGLRLSVRGARTLPNEMVGDPTRLRQIFNNLFSNAIKFTPTGRIRLHIEATDAAFAFTVQDDGPGLSAEQLGRLFQPFVQADETVARRFGGTGLGLALSRDLALLMGGDLFASSQVGAGARFTVSLPRISVAAVASPGPSASPVEAVLGGEGLRILVVDDHEINRRAMALVLEALAMEASYADCGEAALELLAAQPFDVVLLDVHMPGLDGLQVLRRLRTLAGPNRKTPVIAVTGASEESDRRRYFSAGMAACVGKPIDAAELVSALSDALASEQADGEPGAAQA